ncbi:tape measure domain-containing protein [Novosphingobium chloroacetimidivorans]|uniref:Tape measure domain-containing protein n=1 Tax=Novosphingobium chloroacetimidivorans TaxID=1428314 RepID=A0A7W7KC50_9SPHN|nr:tape measure protein [Novosphingobium chloroacetimidivorans]MBB4859468.1 tape measure domain-containing protein [Novosphingobium chloroacetimidivorans]
MASSNALTTRFAADIGQFERELRRLQNLNARAAARLAADQARAAQRSARAWNDNDPSKHLQRQISSMRDQITRFAPVLAGMWGAAEVLRAADTWTRFTNSLKVAGIEMLQLKGVQEQLFAIAQQNGVEIEALGVLYGKSAGSAKELGASQADLIKFTSTVATALKVQGGSAESAGGALHQLAQALGGGKIQAEEYNSIIDGARPLLEAAAAGNKKWGGSVAALTKDVKAGKVTSKAFFDAILAGSSILDEKAAKAATTLSQAFTVLSNSFTQFVGQSNQASGATLILVEAIKALANNLPAVATALTVIAGLYTATFIPGIARATTALAANAAAAVSSAAVYNVASRSIAAGATTMNVATRAASALTAVLGGPLGIALTAIAAGMAYWAYSTATANARTADLQAQVSELATKLDIEADAATNAAAATGNVSKASVIAGAKTRGLAVDVATLTDKYQLLAEAARQAAYDIAKAAVIDAQTNYNKKVAEETAKATPTVSVLGRDPKDRQLGINDGRQVYAKQGEDAAKNSPEARALAQAKAVENELRDPKSRAAFVERPGKPAPADPAKKKPGKKGSTPSDGTDEARQLEIERRQLLLQETVDLGEKLKLQREILALQTEEKLDAIQQRVTSGQLTKAGAETLTAKTKELAAIEEANIVAANTREVAERTRKLAEEDAELAADKLRTEADLLEDRAKVARTTSKQHQLELDALQKRQEADRLEFQVRRQQYEADLILLGLTRDRIDSMLAQMDKTFEDGQQRQTDEKTREQSKDNPSVRGRIKEHADSFGTLNAQLGDIANGALDDITSGFTDAIMGAKSFQEAIGDMAKSVIASLIKMAVQFVIFEAIGQALGIKGLGKSALGISKQPSPGVSVGRNVAGTNNWRGGLTTVGENGKELVYLPGGSQIAPNNLLSTALQQNTQGRASAGNTTVINTTVNANDAVLTHTVKGWIQTSQMQAVQAAQKMTNRDQTRRNRNTLYR